MNSVFDHDANPDEVNRLRAAVIDDILSLNAKYVDIGKITIADLDFEYYERLCERYHPLVKHGRFALPKGRSIANELIWKWTELTGKYTGCQYWSAKAKQLFDQKVQELGGWPISGNIAQSLANELNKKKFGHELRPKHLRLTHEHVYPIKDMNRWLSNRRTLSREEIEHHFDRQCVACVLLESEHDRSIGHDENPWLRYRRARIYLAPNPAWPELQRLLINEADLVEHHQ